MSARRAPSRLGVALALLFALAMVMGPGPGLFLVAPSPDSPGPPTTLFGLPIVYTWGLIWFAVEAGVLVAAYALVWRRATDDG